MDRMEGMDVQNKIKAPIAHLNGCEQNEALQKIPAKFVPTSHVPLQCECANLNDLAIYFIQYILNFQKTEVRFMHSTLASKYYII